MWMLAMDAFRVVIFAVLFILTTRFFWLAVKCRMAHTDDAILQQHFLEHAVASLMVFLGSAMGTVWSVVHLFSEEQNGLIETPFTVAFGLLTVGAVMFIIHMMKEQTPGHPFYIRETGQEMEALKQRIAKLEKK